jgi:hypothetical protein
VHWEALVPDGETLTVCTKTHFLIFRRSRFLPNRCNIGRCDNGLYENSFVGSFDSPSSTAYFLTTPLLTGFFHWGARIKNQQRSFRTDRKWEKSPLEFSYRPSGTCSFPEKKELTFVKFPSRAAFFFKPTSPTAASAGPATR